MIFDLFCIFFVSLFLLILLSYLIIWLVVSKFIFFKSEEVILVLLILNFIFVKILFVFIVFIIFISDILVVLLLFNKVCWIGVVLWYLGNIELWIFKFSFLVICKIEVGINWLKVVVIK